MAIKCKIAKADLKHGAYYAGRCRNAQVARWDANFQVFLYWRSKLGHRMRESIRHPEDLIGFDCFIVDRQIEEPADLDQRLHLHGE